MALCKTLHRLCKVLHIHYVFFYTIGKKKNNEKINCQLNSWQCTIETKLKLENQIKS